MMNWLYVAGPDISGLVLVITKQMLYFYTSTLAETTKPIAVTTKPRPGTNYKADMFFFIHTSKE
jgi:hypothetical protein